jgi:uncharacterized protein
MRIFTIDLPDSSLEDVDRYVRAHFSGNARREAEDSAADQLRLDLRQALLPLILPEEKLAELGVAPAIGRLTINISNACNLWCSYCYADKGYYHAPKSFMAEDFAERLVDEVLARYGMVDTVHYFGGEPLMNLKAIDAIGKRFASAHEKGRIPTVPKFVATTNGTVSSPAALKALERWGIELTISIDGPKAVHDANRPAARGGSSASSFDRVTRTLELFTQHDISYDIECTYNQTHVRHGYSVTDLLDFFADLTGDRLFHISPVFLPRPKARASNGEQPNGKAKDQLIFRGADRRAQEDNFLDPASIIPSYRDAARSTVDNLFKGDGSMLSFAHDMTLQLLERSPTTQYCPAFFHQLSLAIDGSAYPCFMFIGDPRFRMGNIMSDTFPTKQSTEIISRYFREFGFNVTGTREWYAPLHSGCIAGEYVTSSTLAERTLEPLMEAIAEECVLGVSACTEIAMGDAPS